MEHRSLARRREAAGISQRSLARYLGVSQPFVCRVERGDRPVPVRIADRWAAAIGVDVAELTARVRADLGPDDVAALHRVRDPDAPIDAYLDACDVINRLLDTATERRAA